MFGTIRVLWALYAPAFMRNEKGTPSIETVLIIALIALAVSPFLTDLGTTIGNVFDTLSGSLESTSGGSGG